MSVAELNKRSLEVFKELVEAYVETGDPVGSRTLSRRLKTSLSPATIRNVMADLEEAGLLYAPHTSAGRLPTEEGLRLFVHGLLEVGNLSKKEQKVIETECLQAGKDIQTLLGQATHLLSGLSKCASLVMAPKIDHPLEHMQLVHLGEGRALMILISQNGVVENRLIEVPKGITTSNLYEATNYLSARLKGKTLKQAQAMVEKDLETHRAHLDELTTKVVSAGLAVWGGGNNEEGTLIINGQSNLLQSVKEIDELEKIRGLFEVLDTKKLSKNLLEASIEAGGVQIFIGAENQLFNLSGCSLITSTYQNSKQEIIGAIGVIGPSRMNYGRIIPLVDYTAKVVSGILRGNNSSDL